METPEDFGRLCRLCGVGTFRDARVTIFLDPQAAQNLRCLPVEVTMEDSLPKVLCSLCAQTLQQIDDFFVMVKETEVTLIEMLNRFKRQQSEEAQSRSHIPTRLSSKIEPPERPRGFKKPSILTRSSGKASCSSRVEASMYQCLHCKELLPTLEEMGQHTLEKHAITSTKPACEERDPLALGDITCKVEIEDSEPVSLVIPSSVTRPSRSLINPSSLVKPQVEYPKCYVCFYCKELMPSVEATKAHILSVHTDSNKVIASASFEAKPADAEDQRDMTAAHLYPLHSQVAKPFTIYYLNTCGIKEPFPGCSLCHAVFPSMKQLGKHQENHEQLIRCLKCGLKFQTMSLLQIHMRSGSHVAVPDETKGWQCAICGVRKGNKGHIVSHMVTHSKKRPYKCTKCPLTFKRITTLKLHERRHNKDWKVICQMCGRGFMSKMELNLHQAGAHGDERPFMCDVCGKAFKTKGTMQSHFSYKHAGRPHLSCDICKKTFMTKKTELARHMEIHLKTPKERKKFRCIECNAEFVTRPGYIHHISIHTGEVESTLVSCHLCGKKLSSKLSLREHLLLHSGVKSFVCEQCGKSFAKQNTLKVHLRSHRGERPYKCEFCEKTFTQRNSLCNHTQKQHNKDVRVRRLSKYN